ncbi:MAG: DnaJ C-terminal domain-containing protein [Chitinophagaceae bacterium]|jgi:curved DNA-binding protein|nr:J domain-containing protein [Flavisolibacter sp.]
MEFVDYYKILGIDKSATTEDVRKTYRKLARKYHPDLNPNDKEAHKKFQQINEANEVLSDPAKRKKYDQYGKDWQHADQFEQARNQQSQRGARAGGASYSGGFDEEGFSDFFASMFGEGGRRQTKFRGNDYQAELHLNLKDAFTTHQQTLTVNNKNIRITIPAGVENGQKIKLKGHGGPGVNGGPAGDLFITFIIADDPVFKRDGKNLLSDVKIDLYIAVLGGDVTIDTLHGKLKLKVPPETQNGTTVRLKGKGFPVYKKENEYGDLFVSYTILVPKNLTTKEKELFHELSKLRS